MSAIKAIETHYAGCRFRSRLEARWAVFFDTLGITWEYEAQGYELEDGTRYLPDFWLPGVHVETDDRVLHGIHVEVKGSDDQLHADADRLNEMVDCGPMNDGLLILGPIPAPMLPSNGLIYGHWVIWNRKGPEGAPMHWAPPFNPEGWLCLESGGRSTAAGWLHGVTTTATTQRCHHGPCDPDRIFCCRWFDEVHRAYTAARSARFEWGEQG